MLFFAPILSRGGTALTVNYTRGVAQYGEKRWRTDQVGSPDADR
jgi:hypothetical protein